jgi:hypothetical protein
VSSISQHFATSNPFSSLPTTYLVKKISFLCTSIFSFYGFFVGHDLLKPSKLVIARSKTLWESLIDSSFSIWRTSKNSSQQSWTSYVVLSFNCLNQKPFLTLVKESPSLILSIEQMEPTTCFFLGPWTWQQPSQAHEPKPSIHGWALFCKVFVIIFHEMELYQGLLWRHKPHPPSW